LGKPYSQELKQLPETYDWARRQDILPVANIASSSSTLPVIAVGSGGSLTVAHFTTRLHQHFARRIAKAVTPLDIVESKKSVKNSSVILLTAGGRNPDVIGAFKNIVLEEPQILSIVGSKADSPLSKVASAFHYVNTYNYSLPAGKDGFLATNSTMAASVLLYRAWEKALSNKEKLPESFADLLSSSGEIDSSVNSLSENCLPLLKKDVWIVLYGPSTSSAAIDLESKFTEAGLGVVQLADYRNFAHGRHYWLSKHKNSTGVLALMTNEDEVIAKKTLELIPDYIPKSIINVPHSGVIADLSGIGLVLYLVDFVGKARGIDPGRPGVPLFGSKIYRINAFKTGKLKISEFDKKIEDTSIERKTNLSVQELEDRGEIRFWRNAYESFIKSLTSVSYKAIIFDYDGTLCDMHNRYKFMSDAISSQLVRILKSGVTVGVATGRGRSVKEALREKIPNSLWSKMVIGYYNGAENGLLSDDLCPNREALPCEEILAIKNILDENLKQFSDNVKEISYRYKQITIEIKSFASVSSIFDMVQQVINQLNLPGVKILFSTHSIDILAPGVSKISTLDYVEKSIELNDSEGILCIGDSGKWPGNDYDLLGTPFSLSVEMVSSSISTCWNIAPPGIRGTQATEYYLQNFDLKKRSLKFASPKQEAT
jgi:hydroxymethylpyrimidine pyrophosphatase-like HAD family hydrolase